MNLIVLIIGVVLFGQYLKSKNAAGRTSSEQQRVGTPAQNCKVAPDCTLVVTNVPITEAAYSQDPTVPYVPAFGASELEYDGQEYLI